MLRQPTSRLAFYFLCFMCASTSSSSAQHKVEVIVYPGSELLSTVHLLSDSAPIERSIYRTEVEKYFAPWKNDPAVQKARRLPYINCDFPLRLSWAFYNYPDLKLSQPETLVGYEDFRFTKAQIQDYFTACLGFYHRSHFKRFYEAHRREYQKWVASFNRNLNEEGLLKDLDDFYGFVPSKKIIVTLGAMNCGTYAVPDMSVINPYFKNTMVLMIAYSSIVRDKESDTLEPSFFSPTWASQLLWHEMGHAYLSDLFAKYRDAIDSLGPIAARDTVGGQDTVVRQYSTRMGWLVWFNENVTQAITSYLRIKTGKMERDAELRRLTVNTFSIHVPELIDIIEQNYPDRSRYRDFRDFFPILLREFRLRCEKN
jgi:hypothetical protein